jgi:hypothetical protein
MNKPPLTVIGMLGIGDNLHQRAPLRALMSRYDVTLEGFYPAMVHDLIAAGMKFRQLKCNIAPRIKDSGHATAISSALPNRQHMKVTYTPGTIRKAGGILAAQFASCGLKMPEKPDFRLPVPMAWREKARAMISRWNTRGKPILIYRPIVLNKVWECPSRSPDPEAYAAMFREIRDGFFVVSVADLRQKEWIVGDQQEADIKLHQGEADFEALTGLFAEAALVFCNPGFSPVLAQAVGTPSIIVYGGNESYRTTNAAGAHLAPTLAVEPIRPCECHARTHDCDKRIDIERWRPEVRAFAHRFGSDRVLRCA